MVLLSQGVAVRTARRGTAADLETSAIGRIAVVKVLRGSRRWVLLCRLEIVAEAELSRTAWPKTADAWVSILARGQPPVLKRTQDELSKFADAIYEISVADLARIVENDPMMTLNLMIMVGRFNGSRPTEIETIEEALLMIGCGNFIEKAMHMPCLDVILAKRPDALLGALRGMARARRAGAIAKDLARVRADRNEGAVVIASLLFETAEVLAWVYAPDKMIEFVAIVKENPRRKIALTRWMEFGFEWEELGLKLLKRFRFPALVIRLIMPTKAEVNPSSRLVALAAGFSRKLSENRDPKGIARDFEEMRLLVKMPSEKLIPLLKLDGTPYAVTLAAA